MHEMRDRSRAELEPLRVEVMLRPGERGKMQVLGEACKIDHFVEHLLHALRRMPDRAHALALFGRCRDGRQDLHHELHRPSALSRSSRSTKALYSWTTGEA